ncbi:uncharacterized protein KGF55_001011 [Candida pseudojiufengensis]|uniref:uncharacterized protein n=1 Tax=Candida pseudojiufengensis TaxID=497109 RepID=UPI002225B462|nr:uncharacterized protein KGF55_001011 [Candida pseudojiufengensis]KAI5965649.1 hypothetical protein KGF55_001011 [Candida pseudojiufengensis]
MILLNTLTFLLLCTFTIASTIQTLFVKNQHQHESSIHTMAKFPAFTLSANSIQSLGLEKPNIGQYAGYFKCDLTQNNMFYWFFESRNDPKTDPLILWLTGGPGCSSSYGLFFELGPSSIDLNLKPKYNPYSWNSNASVIFLDQPTGTGFSYGGLPSISTDTLTQQIYIFLEFFFDKFPQYRTNKFHIAGESYAGHYIPNLLNQLKKNWHTITFEVESVLIGNGIIDPLVQIGAYEPMACGKGGYKSLLDDSDCRKMRNTYNVFKKYDKFCYLTGELYSCTHARKLGKEVGEPFYKLDLNPYDFRKPCIANTSDCYLESQPIDKYLNLPEVKSVLGVKQDLEFKMCRDEIAEPFEWTGDNMRPSQQYLKTALEIDDIPVLIYSGDKDYMCGWVGLLDVCDKLDSKEFAYQPLKNWINQEGEVVGQVKSFDGLTFVRVYDAGHMVPFDQPKNSLELINRWISGDYSLNR